MNKARLILYCLFSMIAPCAYLIIRFNLFTTEKKVKIGFWGVVMIAIVFIVSALMMKFYLAGLKTKFSYFKQIVEGLIKFIMPLVILLLIFILIGNNIALLKEALFVIIPCETIAVFINPFPKWCFDNNIEGIGEIFKKVVK